MDKSIKHITNYFSKQSWKPFWIGFIYILFGVLIQQLGFHLPRIINMPTKDSAIYKQINILENLKPKLEEKVNNFKLNFNTGFIPKASAAGAYDLASAYIVADFDTGEVLFEKDSNKPFPIASLTKIMTAITALDLASQDELFTVSRKASSEPPTRVGVVAGQKLSVEELLNGALLTSGNDTAQVLSEGIDSKYGGKVFVDAMNKKAQFLKLNNTNFANPQGFDSRNNYSSAADLAVLSVYALKNYPEISAITQKDYQYIEPNKYHKQFDLYNWNGLLGVYPGVKGLKIGNTENAGYTTAVYAERENKHLVVILLGADGVISRDLWASELLDEGFKKLANLEPIGITQQQLLEKYNTWQYWN